MSVLSRLQSMGEDGTELNLDGISKPDLNQIKSKAATITELSMNLCKLSVLSDLPSMPSLYKLHLNDNNLTDISEIVSKCPSLLELSLSGNKKIASLDQLKSVADFKTLMRLDLEGCAVTSNDLYRKELFSLCSTLACIDNLDSRGNEVPDDDDDEEEEDGELSASDEEEKAPGLSALYGGDLPSESDDDDYNSAEEPEGSDGEDDSDHGEPEQPANQYNDEGAGPSGSGLSKGPPPKRAKMQQPDSDDSD